MLVDCWLRVVDDWGVIADGVLIDVVTSVVATASGVKMEPFRAVGVFSLTLNVASLLLVGVASVSSDCVETALENDESVMMDDISMEDW